MKQPGDENTHEAAGDVPEADADVFDQLQDPGVRDTVIELMRAETQHPTMPDTDPIELRTSLSVLLLERYRQARDPGDLDEAVQFATDAERRVTPGHPVHFRARTHLMDALAEHFNANGTGAGLGILDQIIRVGRLCVADLQNDPPTDLPLRVMCLSTFSSALRTKYVITHDQAALDEAIEVHRLNLRGMPDPDPQRMTMLTDLQSDLQLRFEYTSRIADLREAVGCAQEVFDHEPPGPYRVAAANNLAVALNRHFDWVGEVGDLDRSISVLRQARADLADDDPVRFRILWNLCYAQTRRFERLGDHADMNESVDAGMEAVRAAEGEQRTFAQCYLGNALRNRFRELGALEDINEAVSALREAAGAIPDESSNQGQILNDLANALRDRFRETGDRLAATRDRSDLDEAVEALRAAVRSVSDTRPAKVQFLYNLAITLEVRAEHGGPADDLDDAIDAIGQAIALSDEGNRLWTLLLETRGGLLSARSRREADPADLDSAIEILAQAVRLCPADHSSRARILYTWGDALSRRARRSGIAAHRDEAIDVLAEAVRLTPEGSPGWSFTQFSIGSLLYRRFQSEADPEDFDRAVECFRTVTSAHAAPLAHRIAAAGSLGEIAAIAGRWSEALAGYSAAVELLPPASWQAVGRADREHLLATWTGLASEAASCAVAAGQPEFAVDLLEHGRGVLWSQSLEMRSELDALAEREPELARRIGEVRAALDAPADVLDVLDAAHAGPAAARAAHTDRAVDRQFALAQEWDELVTQARTVPGSESFLRRRTLSSTATDAADGAIVVVNVSRWGSAALAVTADGVRVIELPDLSVENAVARTNHLLRAQQAYELSADTPADRVAFELTITATLEWLWDSVAKPVLTALGHTRTPGPDEVWPRVWWCPTGPLTLLPLHAAGRLRPPGGEAESEAEARSGSGSEAEAGSGSESESEAMPSSVMDLVISSYTPTVQALTRARALARTPRVTQPPPDSRMLVVAMPTTPGQAPLPNVLRERDQLAAHFADGRCTLLEGAAARREAVRRALGEHRWVHFSCHGTQDLGAPSRGGVLLEDGLLTVADISGDRYEQGEFAFLSACRTAVGGAAVVDEAITTVAALQYAGWQHVIGTLWAVWDSAAADITAGFYARQFTGADLRPAEAAACLHHAVRELRAAHWRTPSVWAPFVHTGP